MSAWGLFLFLCGAASVSALVRFYLHHVFIIHHQEQPKHYVAGTALRAYIKLQQRHCLRHTPHLCDIYADTGGMCPAKLAGSFGCEAQSKRAKATVSFLAHAFPANYGLCNPWSSLY
jgi:hypothetical protein